MIEKLKALEAAATPGPWQADLDDAVVWAGSILVADVFAEVPESQIDANTQLWATLRNLAPELIALWEALQAVDHNLQPRERIWDAFDALNAKAAEVLKD